MKFPDFPWDSLVPYKEAAASHPLGILDLSVGSPVDPVPELAREAVLAAFDSHSYPQTMGTPALRQAIVDWYHRRHRITRLEAKHVLPTIGSKEMVGTLALALGVGPGDTVVQPELAYPTYEVGAIAAGANLVTSDDPADWPENTRLIWLNSPNNPTGEVLSADRLRAAVQRARELDAVIVNDECYLELGWETDPVSILSDEVNEARFSNILAVYSLSKQSNLAGYRFGTVAGCSKLIAKVLEVRKHLGLIPPMPVQAVATALLGDDTHVAEQKERYRQRRTVLLSAFKNLGFTVEHSEAGLYLWATEGEDCWASVSKLSKRGILVTPGVFYGESGRKHVRIALTASDEQLNSIEQRMSE